MGEHCSLGNPGPGERCSLKLFEVSPSQLPGHQGIWERSLAGQQEGRQLVPATVGKAQTPEPAHDGLCQTAAGLLILGSAFSAAGKEKWLLPPCPAVGSPPPSAESQQSQPLTCTRLGLPDRKPKPVPAHCLHWLFVLHFISQSVSLLPLL